VLHIELLVRLERGGKQICHTGAMNQAASAQVPSCLNDDACNGEVNQEGDAKVLNLEAALFLKGAAAFLHNWLPMLV